MLAGYLPAQLRYTRLLFGLGPLPEDPWRAREEFTAAGADARPAGWGTFWLGVPEADRLRVAAGLTVRELELPWLLRVL
ncbi:hypothetical protein [Streptomyces sp. AB3(2024)]|uniref:hypothetical protein n=1 Tax=Streptomyces sp. AB3(2024) TaxID=3317321 RepID=UPI0035A32695